MISKVQGLKVFSILDTTAQPGSEMRLGLVDLFHKYSEMLSGCIFVKPSCSSCFLKHNNYNIKHCYGNCS